MLWNTIKGRKRRVLFSGERTSEGYAKNGYPVELGRMRVKCGCNWTAIPGREYPLQDVTRINMGMALHYALEELQESKEYSIERLWELFFPASFRYG